MKKFKRKKQMKITQNKLNNGWKKKKRKWKKKWKEK